MIKNTGMLVPSVSRNYNVVKCRTFPIEHHLIAVHSCGLFIKMNWVKNVAHRNEDKRGRLKLHNQRE